ncbi:hypothetical protein ACG83_37840 [Frankia sp. R43]|nr:hypothetical protein ACG83_37840 [Frankia sp. R43]
MVALLSSTVLVVAACSGPEHSPITKTACSTPGFSATSVRIGQVYPDSGVLAEAFQPTRSGVEARIQQANAEGGINGRTIEYVWADDRGDVTGNTQAVHKLVDDDEVFGLVETTLVAAGSAQYLDDRHIPVTGMPAETLWTQHRNMFSTAYTITESGTVDTFGRYIRAQGGTTAAIIRADVMPSTTDITGKIEQGAAQAGVRILPQSLIYNPTVSSPTQLAAAIRQSGADVLIGSLSPGDWANILPAVAATGTPIRVVLAPGGYDPKLLQQYGTSLAGLSTFISLVPFELGTAAHQRYLRAMANYAPELADPRTQLALTAYVQTDLLLHGLTVAGPCPSREQFIERLRAVKDYNAGGLLPTPVDLTATFGKISQCYAFLRVNNAGNGFEVAQNPGATAGSPYNWCGDRID